MASRRRTCARAAVAGKGQQRIDQHVADEARSQAAALGRSDRRIVHIVKTEFAIDASRER
jgi:hypothetical protein